MFSLHSATGVPYTVRIFAMNGAGNGTACNVTDFGDEGGKINISCYSQRRRVVMIFTDYGLYFHTP